MAISDQLTLLNNTKTAIRTAINNKGGSVGANDTFASYATAIDNLPSGGDDSTLIDLIEGDITSITIPSGTTKIKGYTFSACPNLASITIPNTVTSIGDYAFAGSSISSIIIPNSVTLFGQYMFNACRSLTSVTLPNNISTLPQSMFQNCSSLASITIPNTVIGFGNFVFSGCSSLSSITIPANVSNLGGSTFRDCSSLTSVTVLATTPPTLGTRAFDNSNNCPIYVPAASVDAYKAATNWSTYASRIFAIEQVATVDGNPVYNYDLGVTDSTTLTDLQVAALPSGDVLEFAEGVTSMQGQIGGYEEVILPSTFATFSDTQPINAATTTLTSKATTPPVVGRNNLGGSGLTEIYVPAASVDTYKAASAWSNFASIIQGLPSPTPSVTSITFTEYEEKSNPADFGDIAEYDGTEVPVDSFSAATDDSTFDSDIKAAGIVAVEDNNGNDITSQCTFASEDYGKWDSTQDPEYDGESEPYYEWRLYTTVTSGDEQSPHSATITATYGNLSDTFTIEWTTTSNGVPEPEPDPEETEE